MKWNFKDFTSQKALTVEIKERVTEEFLPLYVVSLRDSENDEFDIGHAICSERKASSILQDYSSY